MVMAQIMIAMQIVYEEKFMDKHNIHPLRIIGLEGEPAALSLLSSKFVGADDDDDGDGDDEDDDNDDVMKMIQQ